MRGESPLKNTSALLAPMMCRASFLITPSKLSSLVAELIVNEAVATFPSSLDRCFSLASNCRTAAWASFSAVMSLRKTVKSGRAAPLEPRDHQFHDHPGAVLAAGGKLETRVEGGPLLDGQRSCKRPGHPFQREELVEVVSDGFRGRVSEQQFGCRIELDDLALAVDRDDRIERRFQNGGLPRFGGLQRTFGPPPLGHVAEDENDADDLAVRAADRRRRCRRSHIRGRPWRSGSYGWPARQSSLSAARKAGFSTECRLSSLTMWNTRSNVVHRASSSVQPVRPSATGF